MAESKGLERSTDPFNKGLDISHLPLQFEGFHLTKNIGNGYGEMGRCWKEKVLFPIRQKVANISLNCLYLLSKFNHKEYLVGNPDKVRELEKTAEARLAEKV